MNTQMTKRFRFILGGVFMVVLSFLTVLSLRPQIFQTVFNLSFKNQYLIFFYIRLINLVLLASILISLYENVIRYNKYFLWLYPAFLMLPLILKIGTFVYSKNLFLNLLSMTGLFIGILAQSLSEVDVKRMNPRLVLLIVLLLGIYNVNHSIILGFETSINQILYQLVIILGINIIYLKIKFYEKFIVILLGIFMSVYGVSLIIHSPFTKALMSKIIIQIMETISYGLILYEIFSLNRKRNRDFITKREKQIKLYADHINKVVEKRTKEIEDMNQVLNDDLEYARNIQQSLLPEKDIYYLNTHFVSNYFPCEKLSGDFFDIFPIDHQHIGMYLLDVSGHGVSAAMLTMFCKNSIISGERLIRRYRGLKPHKNLEHFYEEFNRVRFPDETHMVMFFAAFNKDTRVLKYSSGGLNCYPIVRSKNGELYELSENVGFPITRLGEIYKPNYKSSSIVLKEDDLVFFYTDGLIDGNKNGILDIDMLKSLIRNNDTAKSIDESLSKRIDKMSDALSDDITYFIMEVK